MKMVNLRRPPVGVNLQGASYFGGMADVNDHVARVAAGGGTGANESDLFKIYRFLHSQGLLSGTRLLWTPEAGYVQRVDGVLKYCRSGFDVSLFENDLDGSATASQQPRLVGGIAPGSKAAASNQNGEARYFTHPAISFAATDAWSVTVVVDWKGNADTFNSLFGRTVGGIEIDFRLRDNGVNRFALRSLSGTTLRGADNGPNSLIGKRTVVNIIHNGAQTVSIYKNGVFFENLSPSYDSAVYFDSLLKGRLYNSSADILAYHLQSGAMSPTQVLAEYNLLRAMYPEIETVTIDTQVWASRNFEAVATPMWNVIANVTENGAVERNQDSTFDTGIGWSGNGVVSGGALTLTATGSNRIAFNTWLTQAVVGKYYKLTIAISSNTLTGAGTFNLGGFSGSSVFGVTALALSTNVGTRSYIFKSNALSAKNILDLWISAGFTSGSLVFDSINCQELNWSNATEIYDAVYAATSGTAAEKEYAALKEAAMWCYYNNDPANGALYGKLYNWYAAKLLDLDMVTAGFGWRVPTSAQFTTLATYLGGASVAGGKMKMTGTNYWTTPNTGATNESGFTALGSGVRIQDGAFSTITADSSFWDITANRWSLSSSISSITTIAAAVGSGRCIRLIKV